MEIKVNTDNNVEGKQSLETHVIETINSGIGRFDSHITRVEVHLSDENGNKKGPKDKRCLIECRMKGAEPIAVTSQEDTLHNALNEAVDKMKAKLTTRIGRLKSVR